jgi:EmrB/QacA subfamily drug resistance transporter
MHQTTTDHQSQEHGRAANRKPWTILLLLSVAQFMVVLDVTVVNVALPSIGADLGFAAGDLQWVVTAYVLLTGGLLLLGGRMSDLLGRRPVFLTGILVFTGASLASGLASTPGMLIAARAAQGLGAAMLSPAALSIITTTYDGAQRTTALAAWGAIGAGGAAAGVLFGGMLTTWLSWEWVFFINVPVGLVTAALALRFVPATRATAGALRELDLPGALTVVAGLVFLVYAIEEAGEPAFGSARALALFVLSGSLIAAFAGIERRASRPLVPPATWRVRSLVSSATLMFGTTAILIGAFFLNSMFLQQVLGGSALETGLAFLPLTIVIGIAAHVGPHLLIRVGARIVVVGGLVMIAAGELLLAGAPDDAGYATDLLPGFLLLGFGVGLAFVAVSVTAMADVKAERAGLASGLMTTAHEIGAAFGVAIFSAIALGAGVDAAGGLAFADGYREGSIAAASLAATLALVATVAIPGVRPVSAQQAAMH